MRQGLAYYAHATLIAFGPCLTEFHPRFLEYKGSPSVISFQENAWGVKSSFI